ncbi:MAG TPA: TetR/AcrR family transcriptional regulator [Actinocrinis sp.]|nr:TetR/AcrR family transcriptional regulator [Actinocrinis sp.]
MTRRRLSPDQRRAAILAAARDLFGRSPYAAVSMAEIAAAAGVTAPLIVFYYGSKQSLYLEVIHAAADTVRAGLQSIPGPPSLTRLHESALYYARYAEKHRTGFLSLLRSSQEAALPETAALIEDLRAEICAQILADLATADPPTATDAPVDTDDPAVVVALRGYLGFVDATIVHWLSLPDDRFAQIAPETIARLAVGAFTGSLNGLRAPAAPDPASPNPLSRELHQPTEQ